MPRKDRLYILIIVFFALLFRVLYLKDYIHTAIYPFLLGSDSHSYYIWAQNIISGDFFGRAVFMKWPLYPYVLAGIFKFIANTVTTVYVLQFFLGISNCVLVYFIAKKLFNRAVGFISGLLCAWYGLFVFYEGLLVYTSLSLFLNSLLFLYFLRILECRNEILQPFGLQNDKLEFFLFGLFLGICALVQGNIIIFGVLAVWWMLLQNNYSSGGLNLRYRSVALAASFILGLSIIIGTVTLRNYIVGNDFVLVSGNTGINFYLGNNPKATGTFYCPPEITHNQEDMFRDSGIIARAQLKRSLKPSEISDFWFNKGIDFIKNYPIRFIKLLLRKIYYCFGTDEFVHDVEYYKIEGKAGIFKFMLMDARFLAPLWILGMGLCLLRVGARHAVPLPKGVTAAFLMIGSLALSISAFFICARYRLSLMPFLIIFASFGLYTIIESLINKQYKRTGILFLSVIAFYFCLNYYKPNAIAEKPQISAWDIFRQGVVYYEKNDFANAEIIFKETFKLNPLSVDAYYNLGFMYNRQKRYDEAIDMLSRALALNSEDSKIHFELGLSFKAKGMLKEAKNEFNLVTSMINSCSDVDREAVEKELKGL